VSLLANKEIFNMTYNILTNLVASITDLKKHPMQTVESAKGESLAILNRNQPVFYCVPPKMYEAMMDALEDIELADVVRERENEEELEVSLDDL
jgi:antitoxin StbD